MLEKKNNRGESGWIAEEIFEDQSFNLINKCQVIDQQISDGVLDLNDALEVYEVAMDDYMRYFTRQQSALFESRFHSLPTKTFNLYKVKFLHSFFKYSLIHWKAKSIFLIHKNMDQLENDVVTEKVSVEHE